MTNYTQRAIYTGNCAVPKPGSEGAAFPASGHDDPESCQYGAYLFQPDGDENAYYVDPNADLRFITVGDFLDRSQLLRSTAPVAEAFEVSP